MNWNTTVDLGDILTMLVIAGTIYSIHIKNLERIVKIEARVNIMWEALKARLNIQEEES